MLTNAERLINVIHNLPEPLLAKVLDFAEYLHAKKILSDSAKTVLALTDLCGGLDDSGTFHGSSLSIQKAMRDEWH